MNDTRNFQPPTQQEIAEYAYYLWEAEGRVSGRDEQYWLEAEAQLTRNRQYEAGLLNQPAKSIQTEISPSQKQTETSNARSNSARSSKQRQAGAGQRGYAETRN